MTKQSSQCAKAARTVTAKLAWMKAGSAQLDADCTSTLQLSELPIYFRLLGPLYKPSQSIMERKA